MLRLGGAARQLRLRRLLARKNPIAFTEQIIADVDRIDAAQELLFVVQKRMKLALLLQCICRFGPRTKWKAEDERTLERLRYASRKGMRLKLAELEHYRCDAKQQAVDVFEQLAPSLAKRGRWLSKVCARPK